MPVAAVTVARVPAVLAPPQGGHRVRQAEEDQQDPGTDEQRTHPLLDVAQVQVAEEGDAQQAGTAEQEQDRLQRASHSRAPPISTLDRTATTAVAAENRRAKARPNVPA